MSERQDLMMLTMLWCLSFEYGVVPLHLDSSADKCDHGFGAFPGCRGGGVDDHLDLGSGCWSLDPYVRVQGQGLQMDKPNPARRDGEAELTDWEASLPPAKIQQDVTEVHVVAAHGDRRRFWLADAQPGGLPEELEDLHQCVDLRSVRVCKDNGVVNVQADP